MPKFFSFDNQFKKRFSRNAFLFLVFTTITLISWGRILDPYEDVLFDLRFRLRPPQKYADKIVIIEVSDDTLKQLGYWPLPRDFHASLVDILSSCGVKQIMFDFIFTDATDQDEIFRSAIQKAGNVYLPHVFGLAGNNQPQKLPKAHRFITPLLPGFEEVTRGTGFINVYRDFDGKDRWVPLLIDYNGTLYPHIALRMACDYLGISLKDVKLATNHFFIDGKIRVPTSSSYAALINYAGRWKETFRHYSYADILVSWLQRQEGKTPPVNLDDLRGAVCFVGLTATGTSDLRATPVENDYPMVGLHANIFNSILLNRFIYRGDKVVNFFILFILMAFVWGTTILKKGKPLLAFFYLIAYMIGLLLIGSILFVWAGVWIDLFYPLVMMIVVYTVVSIYNFLNENRKRELIEKELSIAKEIQESFLPQPLENFQGLDIAVKMITAKQVGGDLYDIHPLGRGAMGFLIGDVSGKGVAAALVMAKAISLFRTFVMGSDEPSDLLFQLNEEIVKDMKPGLFITATYLIYQSRQRQALIASAGHLATFIFRKKTNTIERIEVKEGMPLGLMERVEFSQNELILGKGDKVILYTDGVIEAKNVKREEFSEERLISILERTAHDSASDTLKAIEADIVSFVGKAPQHDDMTVIILKEQGD